MPDTASVEIVEQIQFYDTDCGGVVSNIAYLRHIERARSELFAKLGMPLDSMMSESVFPVVVRTEIDYRASARLGDEIRVTARLAAIEKVRMTCRYELRAKRAGEDAGIVSEAMQTVVLVRLPEGRPVRVPPEWLKLIG